MEYAITEKVQVATRVASISISSEPGGVGVAVVDALPRLLVHIAAHGAEPAGPPVVIYVREDDIRHEARVAVPIAEALPEVGGIEMTSMPEGPVASTTHTGPYETLNNAHRALREWANTKGLGATGPRWEIFLTDPMSEREPEEYQTEVCLALS